jgi:hypothetical protein
MTVASFDGVRAGSATGAAWTLTVVWIVMMTSAEWI